MNIPITWQSFVTAAAVVGAVITLVTYFAKVVRWVDKQKKQDSEIEELKNHHNSDISGIMTEQTLLVYGVLACLKGLKEQGCNGPVTEAINKIEEYLNNKAHDMKG